MANEELLNNISHLSLKRMQLFLENKGRKIFELQLQNPIPLSFEVGLQVIIQILLHQTQPK